MHRMSAGSHQLPGTQDTAFWGNAEQPRGMLQVSAPREGSGMAPHTPRKERARRSGRHVFLAPKTLAVFTKSDTSAQLQSAK